MSDMGDTLVTPLRASILLEVSTRTIARWADDGTLAVASVTVGGQRRFNLADIERLADQREIERIADQQEMTS